MVSTLETSGGLVYAYIEWYVLDASGQFKEQGEYIWINHLWVSNSYKDEDCIYKLIPLIDKHKAAESAKFVYWNNTKHKRRTPIYKRNRLAKKGVHDGRRRKEYTREG